MSAIQPVFENVSQRQLEAAYSATEERPQVADIYIYMSFPRGAGFGLAKTLFGDGRRVVPVSQLDQIVSPQLGSMDLTFQRSINGPVTAAYEELADAYAASDEERPTRIVVYYSVREEAMDADFSYRRLTGETGHPSDAFDVWFENAQKTGDFSADAMTEAD